MRRLGVFLPRTNHLKTLLPVMQAARSRKIEVSVLCPRPPLTGAGKPELLAAEHIDAMRQRWPWASWSVLAQEPGSWPFDAVVAHGVVHDGDLIRKSGIPWVAIDHLHENAWWYLTGNEAMWNSWHRVCLSGDEGRFLTREHEDLPMAAWRLAKSVRIGYTAFDGPWKSPEEYRAAYNLPQRYMLVGTGVRASGIPASLWRAYFSVHPAFYKLISGYKGPSYGEILRVLKDYCMATGMALVGKARWKHEDHPAHALFDYYFGDDPCDPHRAFKLMRGATVYAGGISGLAIEAMVARVPTLNWAYYDPLELDQPSFRMLRKALWVDGMWQCPGIGRLFRVDRRDEWADLVEYLDTVGPHWHYHPEAATGIKEAAIGKPGASDRVLDACGLL